MSGDGANCITTSVEAVIPRSAATRNLDSSLRWRSVRNDIQPRRVKSWPRGYPSCARIAGRIMPELHQIVVAAAGMLLASTVSSTLGFGIGLTAGPVLLLALEPQSSVVLINTAGLLPYVPRRLPDLGPPEAARGRAHSRGGRARRPCRRIRPGRGRPGRDEDRHHLPRAGPRRGRDDRRGRVRPAPQVAWPAAGPRRVRPDNLVRRGRPHHGALPARPGQAQGRAARHPRGVLPRS